MKDVLDPLVVERMAELEIIENEIKKDIEAVMRVAERFRTIKEKKLWGGRSASWQAYIDEYWGQEFTRQRADRLIASCVVKADIEKEGGKVGKPVPVRAAKSLRRLPSKKKRDAWDAAKEAAGDSEPTSDQVETAVRKVESNMGDDPMQIVRNGAQDFKDLRRDIASLKPKIAELAKTSWGAELASHLQQIDAALHQADEGLKQAAPYCLCVCRDGCRMCAGRTPRWITFSMYRSTPMAIQRKVTDHA